MRRTVGPIWRTCRVQGAEVVKSWECRRDIVSQVMLEPSLLAWMCACVVVNESAVDAIGRFRRAGSWLAVAQSRRNTSIN